MSHGTPSNRDVLLDPDTWYVCQRCTACCRWPGDVRIEDEEIPRMAEYLGMSEAQFLERYTRLRSNRQGLSLIEREDHSCIMLKNGGCRIHEVKPKQCAGFPNYWNFPGWRKQCEAAPIPMEEAEKLGFVQNE